MPKGISLPRLKSFIGECGGLIWAARKLNVHPHTLTRVLRRDFIPDQLREKVKNNFAVVTGNRKDHFSDLQSGPSVHHLTHTSDGVLQHDFDQISVTTRLKPRSYRQSERRSRPPAFSETTHEEPDSIFIPQEARGQVIAAFPLSVRLVHVLQGLGLQLLGDLHGRTFSEFAACRNCGWKTLHELHELVRAVQRGQWPATRPLQVPRHRMEDGCFFVPTTAQELNPFELPLSARLEKTLRRKQIARLGDLHGVRFRELRRMKSCGKKAVGELVRLLDRVAAGDFQLSTGPFSVSETGGLLCLLDGVIANLPERNQQILLLRLGATNNRPLTLEEIGAKFELTRERVRQIVEKTLVAMRKEGGPKLMAQLRGVAESCQQTVCPLTPVLLAQWLGEHTVNLRFSLGFYVRILGELSLAIPAWPKGQERSALQRAKAKTLLTLLEEILEGGTLTLPLTSAFQRMRESSSLHKLTTAEFLAALKHSKMVVVEFQQPDQPKARLRYIRLTAMAKAILRASDEPLTPEDIILRAQTTFGNELINWNPRTLGNGLIPEQGFYLLSSRAYGLRQHLRVPEIEWGNIRTDIKNLLEKENRPISTTEIVNEHKFAWTQKLNAYELAQILREDKQFVDLGRFLFALAAWGIEEREYVKDLIPKVLVKIGRPMSAGQIWEQLQQLRSTSPAGFSTILRQHPLVRNLGFARYGLRSWVDSTKEITVTDTALVERVIRRSEPPLSFSRLCDIFEVSNEDGAAAKLWQTCLLLSSVIRSPDERTPSTLLLHRSCSLERALVATARAVSRPLPLYEFQWELNARFGPLFSQRSNAEIGRCLEHSQLFLRNADGEFILDIHLDQLGLDDEAIRRACLGILSESREIVGCDDLIERLEAEGKVWEELSPDILGSLLREDGAFQEVGHNRFRAKPCKR